MRPDGRSVDQLRPITITPNFLDATPGNALVAFGQTKVLCTAVLEDGVPPFLANRGRGWVTAEYDMLPASTVTRKARSWRRGKADGRTLEIQRLIGRALRTVVDPSKLGERTVWVDCDVLQADGGTRTASVTGAWVALALCLRDAQANEMLGADPIRAQVGAVSVGVVSGRVCLDICYEEDARADTDLNLVMTDRGGIVEVQGTAEGEPFTDDELGEMLAIGRRGLETIFDAQRTALGL